MADVEGLACFQWFTVKAVKAEVSPRSDGSLDKVTAHTYTTNYRNDISKRTRWPGKSFLSASFKQGPSRKVHLASQGTLLWRIPLKIVVVMGMFRSNLEIAAIDGWFSHIFPWKTSSKHHKFAGFSWHFSSGALKKNTMARPGRPPGHWRLGLDQV